jgi:hypothetical protein
MDTNKLEASYRKEIEGWKWSAIFKDCKEFTREENGEMSGHSFLGSVFSLYPSGKYYTFFASGNVTPCSACKGGGSAHQRPKDKRREAKWRRANKKARDIFTLLRKHGFGEERARHRGHMTWSNVQRFAHKPCQECNGRGSVEAAKDEIFTDVLEDVAAEKGGWIESGEGDPCDIFFAMPIESESEETEDADA